LIDLVALDPVRGNLLVVGHNPTLSDLLLTLCPDVPASLRQGLPTGGVAVMALRVNEPLGLVHYDCVDVALADELL
jgi:phosphohistidine phosphatase SixA